MFPLSKSIGKLSKATIVKIETNNAFNIKIFLLIKFQLPKNYKLKNSIFSINNLLWSKIALM